MSVVLVRVFRLAGVQPEDPDAVAIVVLPELVPEVRARPGMGGVVVLNVGPSGGVRVGETVLRGQTALGARDETLVAQSRVVRVIRVHGRPHGNHQFHAQLAELAHHGARVRPTGRVKAPIPHHGPVEIVDHDHRQREASPLVLARHVQQLVLGLVAQFALPETGGELRE
jgi:hypothetical protein